MFQNVYTNATVGINVWMVDSGGKGHFWRFEWVINREMNVQKEQSSFVGCFLRSWEYSLPMVKISRVYWAH